MLVKQIYELLEQAELVETLNATNTTPKRKQQIRNELVKRGV